MRFLVYGLANGFGGVESIVLNMCKILSKDNYFDILLSSDNCSYSDVFDNFPTIGRINITPWGKSRSKFRADLVEIFKKNEYDYVWFNGCIMSNVDFLDISKKYSKAKTIAHSHGSSFEEKKLIKRFILLGLHYLNRNKFLTLTDIPCMCSRKSGFWFYGKKYLKNHEVYMINNGIDASKFKFDKDTRRQYRADLGIDETTHVLFHAGRLTHVKNQKYLIDIISSIVKCRQKAKLVIAGDGPLKNELIEYAKRKNVFEHVIFLGNRTDVAQLYQAADCFVLPSFHEGFPVTLIEAQASGLSCFVSCNITTEVDVSRSVTFLDIKTQSVEKWANSIIQKIHSGSNREDGYNIIYNKRFSIDYVCSDFIEHIKSK